MEESFPKAYSADIVVIAVVVVILALFVAPSPATGYYIKGKHALNSHRKHINKLYFELK